MNETERLIIPAEQRQVNDVEIVAHLKRGGSVVFEPDLSMETVRRLEPDQRDVSIVPGYREGGNWNRAGFYRRFDETVIGPADK